MIPPKVKGAIDRLLDRALSRTGAGQNRFCARFLLAWWNAPQCGGWDLADAWGCDRAIQDDIVAVFLFVTYNNVWPNTQGAGYGLRFDELVAEWRPHLVDAADKPTPAKPH
jgi:hypothetical protein